ncbi:4-alpha-glucanotransferase [Vreelandella sp. EE22]
MNTRLNALSTAAGLLLEWDNSDGEPCRLSEEAQHRLLNSLGFATDSASDIAEGLKRLEQLHAPKSPADWPPLITADVDTPIVLPSPLDPGTRFTLTREQGGQQEGTLARDGSVPGIEEPGYHQLVIAGVTLTLAVAPPRCFTPADADNDPTPRMWGMAAQLYALRRTGDGGIGDLKALAETANSAASMGADALAISPTHAMFSASIHHYSPYSPSSRLLYNVLYCAPQALLGEAVVQKAKAQSGLEKTLAALEGKEFVDWPGASRAKLTWLRFLFDDFIAQETEQARALHEQLRAFCQAGGEVLENHCRFEALQQAQGFSDWHDWPAPLRDPRSDDVNAFAKTHALEISFHAFLQWLVADGLERAQQNAREAGMAVGLIADLAVGVDHAGSQTWSRPGEMLEGLSIGAPPDLFNAQGQDWGLAAFSPWGLVRSGFQSFIDMLRSGFAHAGGLRIDHVLGLMRLWLVPAGHSPTEGGYLSYPLEEMLRLVALESWRHRAIVIGEDLGTVAPGFREKLAARGILGMQVLWFEQDDEQRFLSADQWSSKALATTSTHDLPTVAGWWAGRDIQWRSRLGLLKPTQSEESEAQARQEERVRLATTLGLLGDPPAPKGLEAADIPTSQVLEASLEHLATTQAPLVLIPVEDVLGLEEQANVPNSGEGHPNWRRRLAADTPSLLDCPEIRQRLERLTRARRHSPAEAPLRPSSSRKGAAHE